MSDITAISSATTETSKLSTSTKQKLESLGIDSSMVTSETEAQSLIQKMKDIQKSAQSATETKSANGTDENSSETELLAQAKTLASQVGVTVNSSDSLSEVISKISSKINELGSSENPSERRLAESYQNQLSLISQQYNSLQTSQSSMYSAMNNISANNKYQLNL